MKQFPYVLLFCLLIGCNNNRKETIDSPAENTTGFNETDNRLPPKIDPQAKPFAGPDSLMMMEEDEETKTRRALIYMGIDSTYYAINEIENIKDQIAKESSIHLSVSERNIKSKAILRLNLIQNNLARQVDSVLLINLKKHTNELAGINQTIATNVEHLKDLSFQIEKAAHIMRRLTSVLSFCISRGIVKPPTPISSTAAEVKATVP